MKILFSDYKMRPLPPEREWDSQVRQAVKHALELTANKQGFRTATEIWRNCELRITIGHNIYTTSIEIRPPEKDIIKRRANWRNGSAYYCNGVFWANVSRTKVELI